MRFDVPIQPTKRFPRPSKRVARGGVPAGRLLPLATFYEARLLSSVNPNTL